VQAFRSELSAQWRLAVPVVLAQLGMMAMGVVDTAMVGHMDSGAQTALAATGLGNQVLWVGGSFAFGLLSSLDPILSQALGARDDRGLRLGLQRGFLVAILAWFVVALPCLAAEPAFRWFKQDPAVIPLAASYARISLLGFPFFLGFVVLRLCFTALQKMRPILWAVLVGNLLNVGLNWVLIYGKLGVPAMGVAGSAWASNLGRLAMLAVLLAFARSELSHLLRPLERGVFALGPLLRTLRIGVPLGLQQAFEVGIFGLAFLLVGRFGPVPQAGHLIAINLASLTFMVPLGVANAGSVRTGRFVGQGDPQAVRQACRATLVLALGFMSLSALAFAWLPHELASFYTEDAAVIAMAAVFLPIAGAFQLFDGLQVAVLGLLRGIGETFVPMLINLIGYWAISLPVGLYLAFRTDLGVRGIWWGLTLGLFSVAIIVALRLRQRLRGDLRRLEIES
jgi:MATE family multidrug resistance protein